LSKFTIAAPRAAWLALLTAAHKITAAGKPQPVFSCVRIDAAGGRVTWAATDGDSWRLGACDPDDEAITATQDGAGLVPVAAALPVLKSLPDGLVSLELAANQVRVTAGKFRAQLPTFPILDFPPLPTGERIGAVSLPSALLARLIAHVLPCVHQQGASHWMKGIRVDRTAEAITLAAADGHKLAHVSAAVAIPSVDTFTGEILPWRPLSELRPLLESGDTVTYARDEFERHWFTVGRDSMVLRCVQDKFPDILRVIPKTPKVSIQVDRLQLLGLVRRLGLLAPPTKGITLACKKGQLAGTVSSAERGQADDAIPVDHTGGALTFAINFEYLAALLDALEGESAVLEALDASAPIALRAAEASDLVAVFALAPMRL